MFLRRPEHLHDASQLLLLVLTRKDGYSRKKLGEDTPNTPHINGHSVRHPKNDFWGTIESRLNVCIHLLVLEATRAKIDDLDLGMEGVAQEDILRLKIAVNDLLLFQEVQRTENLFRETPDDAQRKSSELVEFDELIEVHVEELS